ncbi:tyrosine-protein kinase ZAP-70-like isoform X3 [Lytechinus variegatus]|uniref:tyrosine-protein kinase ZAP-70-like isoform X3 n=1 Tax=Lytechinus variegatus TaxID=7654 RepID=UPI001BB26AA6|nr:tyrosine-protein kinase ZAP-70-like isoform X3 [Lytechinus variegatus]
MERTSVLNTANHHHHNSHHQQQQHQLSPTHQLNHHYHQQPTQPSRTMPVDPLTRRFYHGRITREEAEARLRNAGCHQGMFLLRESLGREGNYALSLCYKDEVYHYAIERQYDGTVAIKDGKNFAGPIELVTNHMSREDGLLCRLQRPCNLQHGETPRAFSDMDHQQMEGALIALAKREGMAPDVIDKALHSTQRPQLERALKKIMHQDKAWFHKRLSREEAEQRIVSSGLQEGKFLVRERTEEGSFALSLCYNNFVYHYKIDKDITGQLSIKEGPKFDSLIQMVDHYQLKKDGLLCCLLVPCNDTNRDTPTRRRHSGACKQSEYEHVDEDDNYKMYSGIDDADPYSGIDDDAVPYSGIDDAVPYAGIDDAVPYAGIDDVAPCSDIPPQRAADRNQRRIASEDGGGPPTPVRPALSVSVSSPPGIRSHLNPSPTPPDRANSTNNMNDLHLPHMSSSHGGWDEPEHEGETSIEEFILVDDLPSARPREYHDDDDKIYGVPNDQEKLYDYLAKTKTTKKLDSSCLNLGDMLGKGNFGSVLKGTCMVNGQLIPVAVKTLKPNLLQDHQESEIMKEAELMAVLDHPHIVRMIGICHAAEMMLVLELAELGPLHRYLKRHREMSTRNVLELMYQVAQGMCYLESRQFVHRDLAARNVLLVDETFAKISDFGMSKALGLDNQYYVAETAGKWPLKWYALECIYKFKFSSKSDVWSYGVTLWEALSFGKKPYPGMSGQDVVEYIQNGSRLDQPERCPDDVYHLMLKCWEDEAKDRPGFREIESSMSDILKRLQAGTLKMRPRQMPVA